MLYFSLQFSLAIHCCRYVVFSNTLKFWFLHFTPGGRCKDQVYLWRLRNPTNRWIFLKYSLWSCFCWVAPNNFWPHKQLQWCGSDWRFTAKFYNCYSSKQTTFPINKGLCNICPSQWKIWGHIQDTLWKPCGSVRHVCDTLCATIQHTFPVHSGRGTELSIEH